MSNVSSVKNLNGVVFSAIQDASLTDFVNNNSPIWSEITGVSSTYAKQTDLEQISGDLKGDIDYVSANAITSLDGYATTSEVNSTSSILSGAIDYVSANAGTTYTGVYPIVVTGDTISADSFDLTIGSGLAFENDTLYVSAESVPEGVMVESACEYNAVNEISAYNGSAIAQYGAEKQWLQHDDTIVHVANSAQYAFGVNVSALQRLMGVDETVLWEGSRTSAVTLSEPASSFNKISIFNTMGSIITVSSDRFYVGFCNNISNDSNCYWCVGRFIVNGTSLSVNKSKAINIGSWTGTSTAMTATNNWDYGTNIITKVIGIGRKA